MTEKDLIEFGKFLTNEVVYEDFWAMTEEMQKEIVKIFLEERLRKDKK